MVSALINNERSTKLPGIFKKNNWKEDDIPRILKGQNWSAWEKKLFTMTYEKRNIYIYMVY